MSVKVESVLGDLVQAAESGRIDPQQAKEKFYSLSLPNREALINEAKANGNDEVALFGGMLEALVRVDHRTAPIEKPSTGSSGCGSSTTPSKPTSSGSGCGSSTTPSEPSKPTSSGSGCGSSTTPSEPVSPPSKPVETSSSC